MDEPTQLMIEKSKALKEAHAESIRKSKAYYDKLRGEK